MHLNGENCQNVTLWKWANGQKIYDSEKMYPRGRSAPTRGNIHVYYHNIQRSSSLKPFGQSQTSCEAFLGRENEASGRGDVQS